LLHRRKQLLLTLFFLGVMLRLQLLLCLEARYLLRTRRNRAHRQRACWCRLLVAAQKAGYVGDAEYGENRYQRNDHRHTLLERRLRIRLLWNCGGSI
jgi:hypothetical protein